MTIFACLALLLAAGPARADGYSTDVELVHPGLSHASLPGVDSPVVDEEGSIYAGFVGQYEADPLVLYEYGNEVGPIIGQRTALHMGALWTPIEFVSVRAVLPVYSQGAGQVPELQADVTGLGDASLAGLFRAYEVGPLSLGLRTELVFPTGRNDAYMAEDSVRTGGALLAHLAVGPVDVLLDAGAQLRTAVATDEDWDLGSELAVGGGVRYHLVPDRAALYAVTLSRTGFSEPYSGGAGSPVESIVGAQGFIIPALRVDLGVGKGWTAGYGTTEQRFLLGVTWRIPDRPEPQQVITITEIPQDEPPPPPPEPEIIDVEEPWAEGELARVKGEKIVIRDPIQFEFATSRILPESIPTLRYVATLLNDNDRIGHLVVEGHASEEGSYSYNYDLSIRRSRAIWEQLLVGGVHPNRISYRGMGEVAPRAEGEDEASLAKNRRAEFHIVYQLDPLMPPPKYPPLIQLPWSGGANDPTAPVDLAPPPAEAPPPDNDLDEGLFEQDDDDQGPDAPDVLPDVPEKKDEGDEL